MPLQELELIDSVWIPRVGGGQPFPAEPDPVDSGYVPGWGSPAWRDERSNRAAFGTTIDPKTWHVRGTEVNNFDYATVDKTMVFADTDGYLHITSEFLPTPQLDPRGGTVTASAATDTFTCSTAHKLGLEEMVYVEHVSGGGISTGYYFVKDKTTTTLTLSATLPMYPGTIGPTRDITANTTVKLYRPRFMKTGYIDHRPVLAGEKIIYEQRYGRWEMRGRPPSSPTAGRGVLAAWWLRNLGTITPSGPAGGEIDMMETWGSGPVAKTDPGTSRLTMFRFTTVPTGGTQWKKLWDYDDAKKAAHNDAHLAFHTWTFEYMPTYLKAWRDGVLTASTTPAETPEAWGPSFTNPFHLRVNLHMGPGARYWGIPDPAHPEWTALGKDYVIDYLRVWKPSTQTTPSTPSTPNRPAGYTLAKVLDFSSSDGWEVRDGQVKGDGVMRASNVAFGQGVGGQSLRLSGGRDTNGGQVYGSEIRGSGGSGKHAIPTNRYTVCRFRMDAPVAGMFPAIWERGLSQVDGELDHLERFGVVTTHGGMHTTPYTTGVHRELITANFPNPAADVQHTLETLMTPSGMTWWLNGVLMDTLTPAEFNALAIPTVANGGTTSWAPQFNTSSKTWQPIFSNQWDSTYGAIPTAAFTWNLYIDEMSIYVP